MSPRPRSSTLRIVYSLALAAPLFLAFEIWQLVMCERYLGIKQIARGANPREMGPGEVIACLWTSGVILYGVWMVSLLAAQSVRVYGLILIITTAIGYSLRRNCGLKWILVILTFEGAIRVAALAPLSVAVWGNF